MKLAIPLLALALVLALSLAPLACDDTPSAPPTPAASAPASASAPTPVPSAAPAASPSATAASSAAVDPGATAPTKDTVVSVFDPVKEPARTVSALAGGTIALYLPEWAGTSWKVTAASPSTGKAKEETIPGFAGPTPAHAFTWKLKDGMKGQTVVVPLVNSAKSGAVKTFTLTLHVG